MAFNSDEWRRSYANRVHHRQLEGDRLANPTTDGLVMREKAENRSSKRLATVVTVQIPSAGRPSPLDSPPTIDGCLHSEVCT
jgi:hypothetical protein